MSKGKIAIITSGYFPVPAVLGGAVEALDENIIKQNEIEKKIKLVVFSCYNEQAYKKSKEYTSTIFEFIKFPIIIQVLDKFIYFIAKNVLHKEKSMSYRYILQRLFYINKVAKKLHCDNYDKIVIENHSSLFLTLKKYNNFKKYSGRYFYHLHNVVSNGYGCESIIARCKKVIGVSDYINNTLIQFLGEKDNNSYTVLRNRIDKKDFCKNISSKEKQCIKEKFNLSEKDIIVLFSGRFNPEKGIKELLIAFRNIKNKNIKLLIVGGYYFGSGMVSPFEEEMFRLASNMSDKVKFTGFIPYSDMPQVYAIADMVVIPSIWDDPAPLTVIEALTSGKALITTDSGGIPEYVDSKTGIIVKRDKNIINNLSQSIDMLCENSDIRLSMSREALLKTENWNIETYYRDFCNILE